MIKILCYNAYTESKIDSLMRVLRNIALKDTGIALEEVTTQDFKEKLTPDVAVLILPGARAGTTYREQLKGENFEYLHDRIGDGLWVLGICAGAYVLAKNFSFDEYDQLNGEFIERKEVESELGLARLRAYGPDLRLYTSRPREADNPWTVYTAAVVAFQTDNGEREAALALSKGPSFTDLDPSCCDILATYKKTDEAAIVRFRYGKGGGVLSGPALEVGGQNLQHYIHPRHYDDPLCWGIVTALENSCPSWSRLWGEIFAALLPRYPEKVEQIRKNFGLRRKYEMSAPGFHGSVV